MIEDVNRSLNLVNVFCFLKLHKQRRQANGKFLRSGQAPTPLPQAGLRRLGKQVPAPEYTARLQIFLVSFESFMVQNIVPSV